MNTDIPSYVTQYFWGDDLTQLGLQKNTKYISQTLLEMGNTDALHWLFTHRDKKAIKEELPTLRLSEKSANFWNIYLS